MFRSIGSALFDCRHFPLLRRTQCSGVEGNLQRSLQFLSRYVFGQTLPLN